MSVNFIPTIKREKKKIIQKSNNVPLAVIYFEVITIDGENRVCKKIRAFYEKLFERFSRWANGEFEKYARKCYDEAEMPRKRYRYKPIELRYVMDCETAEDRFLVVDTKITLFKGKNLVSEKRIKHIWDLRNGTLHTKRKFFGKA